jgi:hypothetical protein
MKKYEIALLYGSCKYESVKTYEYNTMSEMQAELEDFILYSDKDLVKIELSILEQEEDFGCFDNLNTYTFCEIYMNELRKGEELK